MHTLSLAGGGISRAVDSWLPDPGRVFGRQGGDFKKILDLLSLKILVHESDVILRQAYKPLRGKGGRQNRGSTYLERIL
jgi:hypothetical protein